MKVRISEVLRLKVKILQSNQKNIRIESLIIIQKLNYHNQKIQQLKIQKEMQTKTYHKKNLLTIKIKINNNNRKISNKIKVLRLKKIIQIYKINQIFHKIKLKVQS